MTKSFGPHISPSFSLSADISMPQGILNDNLVGAQPYADIDKIFTTANIIRDIVDLLQSGSTPSKNLVHQIAVLAICEKVGVLQIQANDALRMLASKFPDKNKQILQISSYYISNGDIFERESAQAIVGLVSFYSEDLSRDAIDISMRTVREDDDLGTCNEAYRVIDQISTRAISSHLDDKRVRLLKFKRKQDRACIYTP